MNWTRASEAYEPLSEQLKGFQLCFETLFADIVLERCHATASDLYLAVVTFYVGRTGISFEFYEVVGARTSIRSNRFHVVEHLVSLLNLLCGMSVRRIYTCCVRN